MKKEFIFCLAFASLTIFLATGCNKKDDGPPPTAPVVTTAALININISSGSATGGGSIVSDGGAAVTQSGIVWSKTNMTPALADSVIAGTTATGTFTGNITGLDFNNTYYFRAFATNSAGTGYGSVVTLITSSDSVKFTYNGQSVTYGIITSPTTGKKWLDRNLGATRTATAYNDYQAYGDLFQWGRPADSHQLINWNTSTTGVAVNGLTNVLSSSDNPGHNNFISTPDDGSGKDDWRVGNNNNRWNTTPQGSCPAGWHVPTKNEWGAEVSNTQTGGTATSGGINNYNTAFSQLKLTTAGNRRAYVSQAGALSSQGTRGRYWSSTGNVGAFTTNGVSMSIDNTFAQVTTSAMALGYSVRCIKD